ncbi:2-dehydro-3-deoxygalactonokinase [Sphingomonas sp. BN140010]|uniref:2-dehydro-3-deoxygalactonokinase n=1 Tax=Sphingomonas arvum TaxID=2992113 RepID=A0ABT3JC09_9SPHN|nr:2-dehydro-3-deoxygalactonokinase [Sphingomonas sp. BN140010]MCW3796603.1 2-dehydro-3-deoxygalactonokinase [Sphingomonas sp. BN140010]
MWTEGIIAVDWGTTNRRAYRLDAEGVLQAELKDDQGITSVPAGGFPAAIANVRERLGDLPLLMAGMIGSNRGWVEAPYVACPAGLPELSAHLSRIERERAAIVPGLSYLDDSRADVMRGEEVQLFGAVAAGLTAPDSLVCHPGTHNKWARLEGGRVTSFRTVMTGELFSLLSKHSILSQWLHTSVTVGEAFRAGVRKGMEGRALTTELFSIRASVLLGRREAHEAASFASGLLIGADVRTGLGDADPAAEVVIMGRPELTRLYVAALDEAGRSAREVDGERAFLAGIQALVKEIA